MSNKMLNIQSSAAPTIQVPKLSEEEKKAAKAKLEKYMKEELRKVKGIFQNFETPGMAVPIQVRKYPGHFFSMTMEDGKEYEVPLYIARHLNGIDVTAEAIDGKLGTCSYPISSHIMDKDGNPTVSVSKRKRRFGFQSVDFGSVA